MIRVTIYNEFYHEQRSKIVLDIYPNGIHGAIADIIKDDDITIKSFTLETVNDITDEVLADTDVIIWWGHVKHGEVPDEVATRVQRAVLKGMGAIFLHSAHYSKPFRALMGTSGTLKWRANGDKERLWTVSPAHPIAKGVGDCFELEAEETYSEPFGIPNPDEVIFIGSYEGGEVFRSGCTFTRGYGKIFYFQPGHESHPTYHNESVKTVIRNAVRWVASDYRVTELGCTEIGKKPW